MSEAGAPAAGEEEPRMRSDELFERGLAAKQLEIELIEKKNVELNYALNTMEKEMEDLAAMLVTKDSELRAQQRDLDVAAAEVKRLLVLQSNFDGKEAAIKVAAAQNQSILIALQTADRKCTEVVAENLELREEMGRLKHFSEKRIVRSATQNERLRCALRFAEQEVTLRADASGAAKKRVDEAEKREKESRLKSESDLSMTREDLRFRREKQYQLTMQLVEAGDAARRAIDVAEREAESAAHSKEASEAAQLRLIEAHDELTKREAELAETNVNLEKESLCKAEAETQQAKSVREAKMLANALCEVVSENKIRELKASQSETSIADAVFASANSAQEARKARQRELRLLKVHRDHKRDAQRITTKYKTLKSILEKDRLDKHINNF